MFPDLRCCVLAGLMVSCPVAVAHHSPARYDTSREVTLTGTVVAFEWVNPHTLTTLEAAGADGREIEWTLEGMSPAHLGRRGWTRYTLRPGDTITVVFFPAKSGDHEGLFLHATLPDGTLKVMAIDPAGAGP